MKISKPFDHKLKKANETLGFFGKARLIRRYDGRHELIGGSPNDRATAKEWCDHFAHDIVFAEPRRELVFAS